MTRRLALRSEHLVDLTTDELGNVAGAAADNTPYCVTATQNEVCDRLVDRVTTLLPRTH